MTKARESQIDLSQTPWYHLVNRCVRRAYLCGVDSISGQNYEHRRAWIEQRIMQLANVFAIDIAAYAIMNNHYHLVARVNQEKAQAWSNLEVLQAWTQLFASNITVQQYLQSPETADEAIVKQVNDMADIYRKRLYDISWFMRVLNESIARMANKEDQVTGHFWEGRFKSQALLDEKALLSVMAYVDLNPVRANIALSLEDSDFTTIQRRIKNTEDFPEPALVTQEKPCEVINQQQKLENAFLQRLDQIPRASLMAFDANALNNQQIPFAKPDYIEFVNYLGQALHPYKKGFLSSTQKPNPLMQKYKLTPEIINVICQGKLLKSFGAAIGDIKSLQRHQAHQQVKYQKGSGVAKMMYG
ncbi:transposase [Thiosulfativibrio zosterae]|uniref:Transposase n=1 Tax=Thiosulfativibrio zosterae TaxID=2675053 RepID=A0A6F8PQ90_9GAMM|nr:transposase [Thiosulfativibrio zosterae]BBP44291.1 transposase [Thiosulfativibrio zosterae]